MNFTNGVTKCTICNDEHANSAESMIHTLRMHTRGFYKCMDCQLSYFWLDDANEHTNCFCSVCGNLECGCATQEEVDDYWNAMAALLDPDWP